MSIRQDLLELTTEALMAQANAGFVKRAQKEIAAGQAPRLQEDGEGIHAHFSDGVRTTLPPGKTIADASCNCNATQMCRHRVLLVLAYQAQHEARQEDAADAANTTNANDPASENPATPADAAPAAPEKTADHAGAWSPAHFDDAAVLGAFGAQAIERARKQLAQQPLIELRAARSASDSPSAILPLGAVRFFSRSNPAQMHCDVPGLAGQSLAVLTIWAFRKARAQWPYTQCQITLAPGDEAGDGKDRRDGSSAAPPSPTDKKQTASEESTTRPVAAQTSTAPAQTSATADPAQRGRFEALMQSLWMHGCQQNPQALKARFAAVEQDLQQLGWAWMQQALNQLHEQILAQQRRDSRYSPQALLRAWSHCQARWMAAHHALENEKQRRPTPLPSRHILGIGIPGEETLAKLRLVSLGAQLWQNDQAQGASIHFADPDTQSLMVLEHVWPIDTQSTNQGANPNSSGHVGQIGSNANSPSQPLQSRRLAGLPLHQIAGGQIITDQARRQASARLALAASARRTGAMPLSATAWDLLRAPIRFDDLASLAQHLGDAPPAFVQANPQDPSHQGSLHVIGCRQLGTPQAHWDGARQCLWLHWPQDQTETFDKTESETETAGETSDAAACDLAETDAPWRLLACLPFQGIAPHAIDTLQRFSQGEAGPITAIAGFVHRRGRTLHLLPLAMLTARRGISLSTEIPSASATSTAQTEPEEHAETPTPTTAFPPPDEDEHPVLTQALELLAHTLNQGLRQMGHGGVQQLQSMAERLQAHGYPQAASAMQTLGEQAQQKNPTRLCANTATLIELLGQLQRAAI